MLHGAWIEREAPLALCPLSACRRGGECRHSTDQDPCRRLHETKEDMRRALAIKLEGFARWARRRDPHGLKYAAPGTPEFERRIKFLYDGLRAADEAQCAEEAAERRRTKKKPARAKGA